MTISAQLKETITELNEPPEKDGADVDAVITEVVGETEYTEADVRYTFARMLKQGEVYPPTEGRVRVIPP